MGPPGTDIEYVIRRRVLHDRGNYGRNIVDINIIPYFVAVSEDRERPFGSSGANIMVNDALIFIRALE
jgi:hypothetical protein